LQGTFTHLNALLNMLAYNPPGDAEGFLFYAPWANHNFNASVAFQDGLGLVRRSVNMLTCGTANVAESVFANNIQLETAYRLNQLPPPTAICSP
jgi:hypothetical protein